MSKEKKLSLILTEEMNKLIERLVEETGSSSKAEVIRRAVNILEVAVQAKKDGKPFGVGKDNDSLDLKIIGI